MIGEPQIVAFGGGGFSMESGNPLLDDYVLSLVDSERPKVCFLPHASGDADHYVVRFYRAFDPSRCEPSHISLFRREQGPADMRAHLMQQDVIYVGGGSLVSLMGVWCAHGIDAILRDAWEAGVVMCGVSAGSLCWFQESVSGFHGTPARVAGLDLLPYSNAVHFEVDSERDSAYRRLLGEGMCDGFAAEDGSALHFVGRELHGVVTSRPLAQAHRMRRSRGTIVRSPLPRHYLGGARLAVA